MKRLLVLLACSALALAGCGDGDSDDAATDDPRTDAQIAEDQAAADAAVLVLADLSPDFTAEPREEDDDEYYANQDQLAGCLGVEPGLLSRGAAKAPSDTFVLGDAEVEQNLTIQPDLDAAATALDALGGPKAAECYRSGNTHIDRAGARRSRRRRGAAGRHRVRRGHRRDVRHQRRRPELGVPRDPADHRRGPVG